MWFVYILKSDKDGRTYTGSTNDLHRRLDEHNRGKVASTKYRRPLKIIYSESYDSETEARMRERWFKSTNGRRKLKQIYNNTGV